MVTKKQTTPLAHASEAARFHRLITDDGQPEEARRDLLEWFDQMCNHTEVNLEHPTFFRRAFLMAAKTTEEMPRRKLAESLNAYCAWQAYDEIQKTLARTQAGESLAAIYAEREAARSARQAAREAENLNAPEPEDKTSDEWRYWKLRRLERAFDGRREDGEAYAEAWREFRALLDGLLADEDFWHTGNARDLLPHLIIARQQIDKQNAREKKGRAAKK